MIKGRSVCTIAALLALLLLTVTRDGRNDDDDPGVFSQTVAEPSIIFSDTVRENANGESVFAISLEDFIGCYNNVYQQEHGLSYLTAVDTDDWYRYRERSPRFGYEALRYKFSEDKTVWPMPTVSIYTADSGEIYELRMTFDDHGYQEKLHDKFIDLCACLIKTACPKLSDGEIKEAFSELYALAYDNFFGDHYDFGDPERPPLSKLLRCETIGFYCFYGSGNIEICMIPLTASAMQRLEEEGTVIQGMQK